MTIASDLREMNDEQLVAELAETRKQLFELRFQAATERLDAPSELRKLRKTIARILTIQREREVQTSPAS
ncbi:MAG TPA: 50S ribosomal protein L29 [Planctomycetaceae bacterium]|nr:50S ribosomal protein L29 [Planctomycetaceae bacterium]HUG19752.1 50S ribosomal protein L29 [Planctomycetaceae bacterium]